MQQPITRADVYEPSLTVRVAGREIDVAGVSMDRALPDPLVGGGLRAASGHVSAVEGGEVEDTIATPWDRTTVWPPAPESPVTIAMGTGAGEVSLLGGGRVVAAGGGSSDRVVDVEVADRYESLDRTISWGALADAMPSETDGVYPRYVGLRATALTDRILRHCGWYATPPRLPYAVLSVPAMGTMWPEVGVCRTSGAQAGQAFPGFFTEPWGSGVTDVSAEYATVGNYSIKSRGRMEMTAVAGRTNGGTMRLDAIPDGGGVARLAWTDTTASVWISDPSDAAVAVVSVPRGVSQMLYATITRVTDSSVSVTLRAGTWVQTATATVKASVVTGAVNTVRINGSGVGGGFQVAFPSSAGGLTDWTPNAVIYERNSNANTLSVAPPIAGQNCTDLLAEQCEAQAATYWIDETGVLRWWDLARLEAQGTVAVLRSDDDIAEGGFTWSNDRSQVKSGVVVKWREPLRERSWWPDVDLYHGNGGSLQMGTETQEKWIEPPNDEVWIMPDLSLDRLGTSGTLLDFNRGKGSWYGAVFDQEEAWSSSLYMTLTRVTDDAFKLTTTVSSGSGTIIQRTLSADTTSSPLWMSRRAMDLPIIRGKAKYTFADQITSSAHAGPPTAPEHVIDAGWWIQRPDQALHTANYAGERMTVPRPVLSSIALVPVPGLQLGDMVQAVIGAPAHITVKGIVTDDSRTVQADMGMAHEVAIRPVSVSYNGGVTWREWAASTSGSWMAWATAEGGTWQQWGANPLNE